MTIQTVIKENAYFDSVTLMTISTRANELAGVKTAMIGMGTDMNLEVIRNVGLYTPALDHVTTGDLLIVLDLDDQANSEEILQQVDELFTKKKKTASSEVTYKTLDSALHEEPDANLVVISVNGKFAAREAHKALDQQKHVMLFSDNVTVDEELALKQKAHEKELFVMGPDCGTAIITGGRDLSAEIGGLMMLDGLDALMVDEQTKAILLISKPPAPEVTEKILKKLAVSTKPVVIYFIGSEQTERKIDNVTFATSSLDAVQKVIQFSQTQEAETSLYQNPTGATLTAIQQQQAPSQKFVRGLFCGGTLCDELLYALTEVSDDVYSNIHKIPERQLANPDHSQAHTLIDFGDDRFTEGRPHPMIDPTSRITRILQEAKDPEVAVLALDFELGYGSHENPVGVLAEALKEAKAIAKADGRELAIIGYVLGTEEDPQDIHEQREILEDLEVLVVDSSHQLCEATKTFVKGANEHEQK